MAIKGTQPYAFGLTPPGKKAWQMDPQKKQKARFVDQYSAEEIAEYGKTGVDLDALSWAYQAHDTGYYNMGTGADMSESVRGFEKWRERKIKTEADYGTYLEQTKNKPGRNATLLQPDPAVEKTLLGGMAVPRTLLGGAR